MRAVIYARVSSDGQAEAGLSVDSQIDACQRKAAALGAQVVKVFRDDGRSGRTGQRPGFQALMAWCRATAPQYLITWSSSRFARSVVLAASEKALLANLHTKVVYASQDIDLATDEGWMADSIQQIFDEHTSRQIAKDTTRSMISAARAGYFMGGRTPYGYQVVPAADKRRRTLQPEPVEAATVRDIFTASAQGQGAVSLAKTLNAQGRLRRGQRWSKGTIHYLLKNEVYMGTVIYGRMDRRTGTRRTDEDVVRVQAHPPLVSAEQWQAVQAGLGQRAPEPSHTPANTQHLFAGLARCGVCGASLQMSNGTGRGKKTYHYYACRASKQGNPCGLRPLPADAFDRWLLAELLGHVMTPENVAGALRKLEAASVEWIKDRERRRRALVAELRDCEARQAKIYEVIEQQGSGAPGITELGPRLKQLRERAQRIELELVQLEDENPPQTPRLNVSTAEAVQALRAVVEQCRNPQALRAFVGDIVQQVTVDAREVQVDYRPECLIQSGGGLVHSTRNWLPVSPLLRTVRLTFARPGRRVLLAA